MPTYAAKAIEMRRQKGIHPQVYLPCLSEEKNSHLKARQARGNEKRRHPNRGGLPPHLLERRWLAPSKREISVFTMDFRIQGFPCLSFFPSFVPLSLCFGPFEGWSRWFVNLIRIPGEQLEDVW